MSDLLKIRSKLIALIQFFSISYPSKPNETTNLTDRNVERTQDLKFLRRLNFRLWSYGLWHLVGSNLPNFRKNIHLYDQNNFNFVNGILILIFKNGCNTGRWSEYSCKWSLWSKYKKNGKMRFGKRGEKVWGLNTFIG